MNSTRWQLFAYGLAAAIILNTGVVLRAQIPDARVVPKGALRITFAPLYTNYDSRFAENSPVLADGEEEPLGADFSSASLGPDIFRALIEPTTAVRSITGDTAFQFNMGRLTTDLDADIRIFPFDFSVGISNRLTLNARMPIVTTRMNSFVALDSTDANSGLNQIAPEAGNATARADLELLITDLRAGASFIDNRVAVGDFGCPGTPQCSAARTTASDARNLANSLEMLSGLAQPDGPLPPGAPLGASVAGAAIQSEITRVSTDLATLGAAAVGGALALPTDPIGAETINTIVGSSTFGYELFPLETTKLSRFGDFEIGFRYLALDGESLRAVVIGNVRLPTGTLESTSHALDLSTGDKQTDVEAGFEAVYETADRLGFSGAARYTLQLSHTRRLRITRPDDPLAFIADETDVTRSPGNIVRFSLHPWLRLGEGVRVFATVNYFNRGSDSFSTDGSVTTVSGATVGDLGGETSSTYWSFGGGLAYRSTLNGRGEQQLPIEAGLNYQSAFSGSGGMTPKFNRLNLYLRLFYRIF